MIKLSRYCLPSSLVPINTLPPPPNIEPVFRDLLQLHHVHGGLQRGHNHPRPQLPPQAAGHSRDAGMGKLSFNRI